MSADTRQRVLDALMGAYSKWLPTATASNTTVAELMGWLDTVRTTTPDDSATELSANDWSEAAKAALQATGRAYFAVFVGTDGRARTMATIGRKDLVEVLRAIADDVENGALGTCVTESKGRPA